MNRDGRLNRHHRSGERGQILVIAVLGLIAMVGGVALLLEGGNAYAQQRGVQMAPMPPQILAQSFWDSSSTGVNPGPMPGCTPPSMRAPR